MFSINLIAGNDYRTFHKGVQASNLPKAAVNHAGFTATEEEEELLDELAESDTHQTGPSCDRCEGETAVCYCLDCGDKICQTHLEVRSFFVLRADLVYHSPKIYVEILAVPNKAYTARILNLNQESW